LGVRLNRLGYEFNETDPELIMMALVQGEFEEEDEKIEPQIQL